VASASPEPPSAIPVERTAGAITEKPGAPRVCLQLFAQAIDGTAARQVPGRPSFAKCSHSSAGRLTTSLTNPYFTAFDDLGDDLAAKFILQNFNSAEIEQQCSVLT
jgi:hypothetical protein